LIEVLRTNDLVLISKAEAVLTDAGIKVFVADRHMSAVEGSLPFLPRRLLVAPETAPRARRLLTDAGLGSELREI
jgi:Putative prokaryotic signal transducing protein